MPGNGTRCSRADSRAEVNIFIHMKRKQDIQLVVETFTFSQNPLHSKIFHDQKISTGNTTHNKGIHIFLLAMALQLLAVATAYHFSKKT